MTASLRDKAYIRASEAAFIENNLTKAMNFAEKLLSLNPKTAYFYDAKFILAQSKTAKQNYDSAIEDLEEILKYATDNLNTNKALCLLGEVLCKSGEKSKQLQAMARFQLVVHFANINDEPCRQWIERSYLNYANLLHKNGQKDEIDKLIAKYKIDFPNGLGEKEMLKMSK